MDTTHPAQQRQLEQLAREMALPGWIVRLETHPPVPGPQACLVVRRAPDNEAYLLALVGRHLIHAWTGAGPARRHLFAAADVDDVEHLLRQLAPAAPRRPAAASPTTRDDQREPQQLPAWARSARRPPRLCRTAPPCTAVPTSHTSRRATSVTATQPPSPQISAQEWGGACDGCRITWAWPRNAKQPRRVDLQAARCPRCQTSGLRPAHGQAAYQTLRASRADLRVDQCQMNAACVLPNTHNARSGWPCRSAAGRL